MKDKKFHWGDKLKYKGDDCLFISYAPVSTKSAYVLLFGGLEQVKVKLTDLSLRE